MVLSTIFSQRLLAVFLLGNKCIHSNFALALENDGLAHFRGISSNGNKEHDVHVQHVRASNKSDDSSKGILTSNKEHSSHKKEKSSSGDLPWNNYRIMVKGVLDWEHTRSPSPAVHDVVAQRRYCGNARDPREFLISNANECYSKCQDLNKSGENFKGFWWKGWGGGRCGCCNHVGSAAQTTNWPDATLYRLPSKGHNLYASKRWCSQSSTTEITGSIEKTRDACNTANMNGKEYKGYWWKNWGGGRGGCCTSISNLSSNWPDASVYTLEPVVDLYG